MLLVLLGISLIIYALFLVNASDAFVWSRYTHFGATHFYRDRWYYFYAWPLFGLVVTVLHTMLARQSLKRGEARLATLIIAAGLMIIIFAFLVVWRIARLPR